MGAYLVKRLLILVPTIFGVSMVIWLVMVLAPGDLSAPGAGGGEMGGADLSAMESRGRNVRMFRRQFNLDRPLFWNGWTTLEADQVRERLEVVTEGIPARAPAEVKDAKQQLDDWDDYAIPALVEILGTSLDEPELQARTLLQLRQAAYTFRTVYEKGRDVTEAERVRDRRIDTENALIQEPGFSWEPGAPRVEREAVVERWRAWFEERRDRWTWDLGERLAVGATDTQFAKYWANLFDGDLGQSAVYQEPVTEMIVSRLKYSLSLAVPAFLIAYFLAILLGVAGATRHGTAVDQGIGVGLFVLYSIPTFVAAMVLQKLLAIDAGLFPVTGFESPDATTTMNTWEHFKDVLWHITLPLFVYTYGSLAYISRQARSGMLRVLRSDFVRTARAKGLPERSVVWRHAVRNGMMPIVTLLGTALPVLIAGSVFIETVFNIDGFGRLMVNSIIQKDFNVVMGIQLIVAMLTLVGLLLTDLIYAAMDPRISFS